MKNQNLVFRRHFYICLLLGFTISPISYASSGKEKSKIINIIQQKVIKGSVKDINGSPLPGASVIEKGTSNGTQTDFDGNYFITVKKGAVLGFSFVGYKTKEIKISNQSVVNVTLEEESDILGELIVVGYGKRKKLNLTGALETITFKDEVNQPVSNSGQLLYGRFAGVQLTQSSGNPGADGSSIVIRGIGTFGSSTPLVVIDNVQYEDLVAFNNLSPTDINSVTVLKDASASAIYGARGANGVILVTTKRGSKDKFEINYNSYYGIQEATIKPSFLGALDYATLMNEKFRNEDGSGFDPRYTKAQIEAIKNGSLPDQFANTNWVDAVLTEAFILNHNFSFSGGSEKSTYRISLGYLEQNAIVKSKFKSKRYNLSFNINSELKKWLTLNSITNAFWKRNEGPTGGQNAFSGDNGIIYSFQRTAPTIPLYYKNGKYGVVDGAYKNSNYSFQTSNPLRRGFLGDYESDQINVSQRLGLSLKLFENLSFETSGSANIIYANTSDFNPTQLEKDWAGEVVITNNLNTLKNSTNFQYRLLNENVLRFNKTFKEIHNVGVLLGHSISYFKTDNFGAQLSGFPSNNLKEFNAGGVVNPSVNGGAFEEAYQSFFGRVTYNYKEKYLAEFNIRRDGSSKFGLGNKYGNFPSGSLGWRISKEKFMKKINFITNLKLRASWGISGNDRIGNYIFAQFYDPGADYVLGDNNTVVGVAITNLANPSIRWEETTQYDIGLDISLFKNKVEITADYFNRDSKDILYNRFPVPNTLGVVNLAAHNSASMINKGLELGINYKGRLNEAKFSIGGNFTKLIQNEVTGLGKNGKETITNTNIIRVGEAFRSYYGYKAIGIFQTIEELANAPTQFGNANTAPGDIRYADISGPNGVPDGIVDENDRTIIGNPNPNLLYNFNGSLEYANFDFNFLFQGVFGVDRLLMGNGNLPMSDNRSNVLAYWIDRYTPENPSANLPRVGGQNNNRVSSFYIQDVSYLRLKNIELGYLLPKHISNKISINKLRFFISGQNLFTFTGLRHFDPERTNSNQSNRGVPLYKIISFGINIKL